jgi:hypothetical protein
MIDLNVLCKVLMDHEIEARWNGSHLLIGNHDILLKDGYFIHKGTSYRFFRPFDLFINMNRCDVLALSMDELGYIANEYLYSCCGERPEVEATRFSKSLNI